jgi:hypothetical protein
MSDAEMRQLAHELTEAKLAEMSAGVSTRSPDQPVKVIPMVYPSPASARGYFTQQKFIWGKTPEEMEAILGIFGKLRRGALVLEFAAPLRQGDFENRAYTYLPDGKEYKPHPNETVYAPGKGAPQWVLTREVETKCIAMLRPGRPFNKSAPKCR